MHTMLLSCRLDLLGMTDTTIPSTRQRVNISQTAKGLHQIDCTVEVIDNKVATADYVAELALNLLKETEKQLKADGRSLVTSEVK